MKLQRHPFTIVFTLEKQNVTKLASGLDKYMFRMLLSISAVISVCCFYLYYKDGIGLAYNDARSHLDIGRRVVEGLKPGLAQLGSVWLPLPHLLMVPTIWNNFFWHTGLAGAIPSMISFVMTTYLIYLYLKRLGIGMVGRLTGVFIFIANLNILYLQSTAMTELLLLSTMTAATYQFLLWRKSNNVVDLVKTAFFVMLATLSRYDAWFLFFFMTVIILFEIFRKKGLKRTEGTVLLFCTLSGFGIIMWFLWNELIFKDPLYFAFGPYSAHAQQQQLEQAGDLATEKNLFLSLKIYFYAMMYNVGAFTFLLSVIGATFMFLDKKIASPLRIASLTLLTPLFFNVIALYLGHSVLYIQGISGNTWFNVRYGIMVMPAVAIFIGYLVDKVKPFMRYALIGLLLFVTFFSIASHDAVTVDDATIGASQKNVTDVAIWLKNNAKNTPGFVLISAASHDAEIFSSTLPMRKFIHEGTGYYWDQAIQHPEQWARWIILRTHDDNDQTYRLIKNTPGFQHDYLLVHSYPFSDIYELKPEYLKGLHTKPLDEQ